MKPAQARQQFAEKCRDLQDNGATVTLDGKPARISGFKLDFPVVWQRNSIHMGVELAWETVYNILTNGGGKFKT